MHNMPARINASGIINIFALALAKEGSMTVTIQAVLWSFISDSLALDNLEEDKSIWPAVIFSTEELRNALSYDHNIFKSPTEREKSASALQKTPWEFYTNTYTKREKILTS